MLYTNYTEELLGLKDISVKHVKRYDNRLCIHIEMHKKAHRCPRCGEWTSKVHDYRKQQIKDIPAFNEMTVIYLRKRRWSTIIKVQSQNSRKFDKIISNESEEEQ